jgi:hypothetical protein
MLLLKCMTKELFGGFSVLWPTPGKYVTSEMMHVCLSNYNAVDKCWNEAPIPRQLTQHNIHGDTLQRTSLLMNCDRIFSRCKEETSPNPKAHDTFVRPRNLQPTAQNFMVCDNYQHCASGNGKTLTSVRTGPVYRSHIHKMKWMN